MCQSKQTIHPEGKDGTQIDFMCLTMIDPATNWFEMVELPILETITHIDDNKKGTKTDSITKGAILTKPLQ
jgi:hypothetical protein